MKKILAFLLIISLPSLTYAQAKKFSVSIPLYSVKVGGPISSIKNEMKQQGYGDDYIYYFLGERYTDPHPATDQQFSLLVRGAYKISNNGSIYVLGGILSKGSVVGFHSTGWYDETFIFRSRHSLGEYMSVQYSLSQAGAGYEYTVPKTSLKLAAAASAFIYKYQIEETGAKTKLSPALNMNIRTSIYKIKNIGGLEVFGDINLAPAVEMEEMKSTEKSFNSMKAGMTNVSVGLALYISGK
jgi:hypothetical protein